LVSGNLVFETDGAAQATGLAAYLRDFRPDTLRINPYADLTPEALRGADLGPVTRVILPFESDTRAGQLRQGFGAALIHQGFTEDEVRANAGSLLYRRVSASR
jgi:hypothetical protein